MLLLLLNIVMLCATDIVMQIFPSQFSQLSFWVTCPVKVVVVVVVAVNTLFSDRYCQYYFIYLKKKKEYRSVRLMIC